LVCLDLEAENRREEDKGHIIWTLSITLSNRQLKKREEGQEVEDGICLWRCNRKRDRDEKEEAMESGEGDGYICEDGQKSTDQPPPWQ
jgi:hypothetical protein